MCVETQSEIITGLTKYGFIVNIIISAGASENQVANEKLITLIVLVNHQVK